MLQIPALSIQQPWAELIITSKKSIEIRSWSTDYRGLLWVHTGLKSNPRIENYFGLSNLFKGGYIGIVTLEAIEPFNYQRWKEWSAKHLDPGNYRRGLFAWNLSKPQRFNTPISGPGKLNLFTPSSEILNRIQTEYERISAKDNL